MSKLEPTLNMGLTFKYGASFDLNVSYLYWKKNGNNSFHSKNNDNNSNRNPDIFQQDKLLNSGPWQDIESKTEPPHSIFSLKNTTMKISFVLADPMHYN